VADGIHHLLVDEFQDTSRRQHQLLASLVAAWPDQSARTVFVVGDPMQSIYFFRDADAELFPRVKMRGLELHDNDPFPLDQVQLTANFRTEPALVNQLNESFTSIFNTNDGSGVTFSRTEPARESSASATERLQLHLDFVPQPAMGRSGSPDANRSKLEAADLRETARQKQVNEIVALIRSHKARMERARTRGKKYRVAVLARTRAALAPIAEALRENALPFRAIDLESLQDRPEILDALSLAKALLNPQDRVAWLGVLRAPWCGLSLEDLHLLVSVPGAAKPAPAVPDLLAERLHLLNPAARHSVERVLNAFQSVPRLRASLPTASLGTLLQQVWLNVGGDSCVDSTARANLNLLWNRLDRLPEGEQDLLGSGLNTALDALCALPDPAASSDCGVQLMTIHKSKGLEFEVVIVPDLQTGNRRGQTRLLSWLERGLAEPDASGDVTEFLVAPLQPKGADRGKAKAWVDRVYCERESQETRRILYVAATRARDELHLFARPAYKRDSDDSLSLIPPSNCLLATAWPAFESEIRDRFEKWNPPQEEPDLGTHQLVLDFAAAAESNLVIMPSGAKPTTLRRLPPDFQLSANNPSDHFADDIVGAGSNRSYERHAGGMASRALGSAVHKLLEELASLRTKLDWTQARAAIAQWEPRIVAQVRSSGIQSSQAASIATQAVDIALKACEDPIGRWILSPHAEAASEAGWAGVLNGDLHLVRVDRIFRAGAEPASQAQDVWWIIDFKTAHADNLDAAVALPGFRATFAPQLQTYAAILRKLHGPNAQLRAGLYYPRMSLFDWWEI
jgi:ATP-dependent exoDNAse (exonuclease V) beta subunit